MRSGRLFLRFFRVACVIGVAVGAATAYLLEDQDEGHRILVLILAVGIPAAAFFLSGLLVRRDVQKQLSALIGYARQILEGRYDAEPVTGQGEIGDLSEAFRRMAEMLREREHSLTELAKFTAADPNLLMKVDPEGRILYANRGVERTLYGMGLPPQHGEFLLPDGIVAILREFRDSKEKNRRLTCRVEGKTIDYTIFAFEDEEAVVFYGEDVTEKNAPETDPDPSRKTATLTAREGTVPATGPADPPPRESPPARPGGTVLVVDDEELVREVAGAMLASLGFEVLTAQNGKDGVELFRKEHPRILFTILDLRMPEMDGTEVFEEIRRIDPEARIVISSGYRGDQDVDRLKDRGAAAVLSKPYTYGEIARVAGYFREPDRSPLPVETP